MNGHILGLIIAASIILPMCFGAFGAIFDDERVMALGAKIVIAAIVFWALASLIAAAFFLMTGVELI